MKKITAYIVNPTPTGFKDKQGREMFEGEVIVLRRELEDGHIKVCLPEGSNWTDHHPFTKK